MAQRCSFRLLILAARRHSGLAAFLCLSLSLRAKPLGMRLRAAAFHLTHQTHFKPVRRIDPKISRVHPVLLRKRGMRWAGAAPVARLRAQKQGFIESFQRLIINGIAIVTPRFGAQAAVPGFPVDSYTMKTARETLEGLQGYFIVIALRRQFQGEADLQPRVAA
jgi:hypothetical protein